MKTSLLMKLFSFGSDKQKVETSPKEVLPSRNIASHQPADFFDKDGTGLSKEQVRLAQKEIDALPLRDPKWLERNAANLLERGCSTEILRK